MTTSRKSVTRDFRHYELTFTNKLSLFTQRCSYGIDVHANLVVGVYNPSLLAI